MRSGSLARVVIASLGISVVVTLGCGDPPTEPSKTPPPWLRTTAEFGGRMVNADTEGPVGNVRVSASRWRTPDVGDGFGVTYPKVTATSGGDGTFTLAVTLPRDWTGVSLAFAGPAGYDNTGAGFGAKAATCWLSSLSQGCWAAADRPAIRMYPTLVIRPGESIDVRVDHTGIVWCGHPLFGEVQMVTCRRVLVAASPGESVELEVVAHDSSKPMALGFTSKPEDTFEHDPDMSVRSLTVPPGGVPYVLGAGTATLTARR
jgi:hypothetical protein